MNGYRFIITYEGEIDAPDYDSARQWAMQEVEEGRVRASDVDIERMHGPARKFTYPGRESKGDAA